jgi:hypothetical protein
MAQRWLLRRFYVVRACRGVGLLARCPRTIPSDSISLGRLAALVSAAQEDRTTYVQNLHTYRTSTLTEPHYVQEGPK